VQNLADLEVLHQTDNAWPNEQHFDLPVVAVSENPTLPARRDRSVEPKLSLDSLERKLGQLVDRQGGDCGRQNLLGSLLVVLVTANVEFRYIFGEVVLLTSPPAPPPAPPASPWGEANPATATAKVSKTEIIAYLKGSFDYCDGVYSGFTDAHLNDPADL
jgi:hypothetical protein